MGFYGFCRTYCYLTNNAQKIFLIDFHIWHKIGILAMICQRKFAWAFSFYVWMLYSIIFSRIRIESMQNFVFYINSYLSITIKVTSCQVIHWNHDFSPKAYKCLKLLDEIHKKHVLMKRMVSWKNVAAVALVSLGVTIYWLEQNICKKN